MNPKVSIIFVNYKTPKMTNDAILSVKEKTKATFYEIIVVDNSCDENEYKELVNTINDNDILIIDAKENLGFGKANNLGAKYAKGKYLLFLNTDTLLINDAVSILADYLDYNENVGVVGPNIYDRNSRPNHSYINNKNASFSLFSSFSKIILHKRRDFNYSTSVKRIKNYVCGACLMIKASIFNKLNGFDKDIFMYAEETLLCYQVRNILNYKIYNVPQAKIIHFEGGSFTNFNENKAKIFIDGNYIYYLKAFGKNKALRFLNKLKFKCKIKFFIAFILRNTSKKKHQEFMISAINNKLKELKVK